MNITALKKLLILPVSVFLLVFLLISIQNVLANSQGSTFRQDVVYSGLLEIIEAPNEVSFSQIYKGDSQSTGVLGTSEDKIRVRNHRDELEVQWSLNLSPDAFAWSDGVNSFAYDLDEANGELVVNSLLGNVLIEGLGSCSEFDIEGTVGGSFADYSAIALVEAGPGAVGQCIWDISGIDLVQYIPVDQGVGDYELPMTLTVN